MNGEATAAGAALFFRNRHFMIWLRSFEKIGMGIPEFFVMTKLKRI
jgi:hypothetical protein